MPLVYSSIKLWRHFILSKIMQPLIMTCIEFKSIVKLSYLHIIAPFHSAKFCLCTQDLLSVFINLDSGEPRLPVFTWDQQFSYVFPFLMDARRTVDFSVQHFTCQDGVMIFKILACGIRTFPFFHYVSSPTILPEQVENSICL